MMNSITQYPPGFNYFPDFLSLEEEEILLHYFQSLAWQEVKMYGVTAKRKVIHYGLDYLFQTRRVIPTTPPPKFLNFIIKRASPLLTVEASEILEVLLTHYPEGAGIGWHRDAPMFDKVFGISLAHSCGLKLRKRENHREVIKINLEPRSAYLLSNEVRAFWEHSIPLVKATRYSITLRTLKD